jgi:subtilisin family serine protease
MLVVNSNALNGLRNHPLVVSVTPDGIQYLHAKPVKTPPTWQTAEYVNGAIELVWSYAGDPAAGFNLERCNGGSCQVTNVSQTSYSDTNVTSGEMYDYRVRAYFSKGGPTNYSSAQSVLVPGEPVPTPPTPPSNLTISAVSNDFVALSWVDESDDEDGFYIARCSGSGCTPTAVIDSVAANATVYNDASVQASSVYGYAVQAYSADGNSVFSNTAQATTAADPVDPPDPTPCDMLSGTRQVIPLGVQRVGLPDCVSNGEGVGVAVVDTGLDFAHPDLAPAPDNPGVTSFNALAPGTSCQDDWSHGTHVAGLIAAADNNEGIVGAAPYATLYCVKVGADAEGYIYETDVFAGIDWILDNHDQVNPPIRVVNMSLGGDLGEDPALDAIYRSKIQALYNMGIVVVTSAGNEATKEISQKVPAGFPEVIAVAGTVGEDGIQTCPASFLQLLGWPLLPAVRADTAAAFTTDGPGVTISAVAEGRSDFIATSSGCTGFFYGTLSTSLGGKTTRKLHLPNGTYAEARGTSFAAPVVAGAAARILQGMPTLTGTSADVEAVRTQLQSLGDRLGEAPFDHPWAGYLVTYSADGVYEGVGQAQ